MTADALRRKTEAIELANRSRFVTGIAIHHGVRANQGKTILVLINVVDRYLPAIGVVAQLALRSVLAAMQVGMAVLALVGGVRELQVGMAIATCHSGVTSAKREAGFGMIELDLALNNLPVSRGMTRGARQIHFTVRALRVRKRPNRLGTRGAATQ